LTDYTSLATTILCGLTAADAARLTEEALENLPADSDVAAYEIWRRRQVAHELQRGRVENAVRVRGADHHDNFVLDAKLVADGFVVSDFRRVWRNQRVAIGAQFQPENSRRGGQGDRDDQGQHQPGMTDGTMRQLTKEADEEHMQLVRSHK
jgi:hypothetical protein